MKYHRTRDTRSMVDGVITGDRLSCVIEASSVEEANAVFEERWRLKTGEQPMPPAPTLPLITNQGLREKFLSPAALEMKRRTPLFHR